MSRINIKIVPLLFLVLLLFIPIKIDAFETHDWDKEKSLWNLYDIVAKLVRVNPPENDADINTLRTHPWLTLKAIELFEKHFGIKLDDIYGDARIEIIFGAIEEDIDAEGSSVIDAYQEVRWGDPLSLDKVYLFLKLLLMEPYSPNETIEKLLPINRTQNHYYAGPDQLYSGKLTDWPYVFWLRWYSAKEWAIEAPENLYRSSKFQKDKKGFRTLGHILHLMQDMGSPAHVRNDNHIGGDPFESILGDQTFYRYYDFSPEVSEILRDLKGLNPINKNYLWEYFDEIANWTQSNYFSLHTKPDPETGAITQYPVECPPWPYPCVRMELSNPDYYIQSEQIGDYKVVYYRNRRNGDRLATTGVANLIKLKQDGYDITFYESTPPIIRPKEMEWPIIDIACARDLWKGIAPELIEYSAGVIALFYEQVIGPLPGTIEIGCFSSHFSNGYYAQLFASDPTKVADNISVTGPGLSSPLYLTYQAYRPGEWWSVPNVFLGTSPNQSPPLTYIFNIESDGVVHTGNCTVESFVHEFATNLSPSGGQLVSGAFTFTWTGFSLPGVKYQVQLNDNNWNRIWNSDLIEGNSVPYSGSPLSPGATYRYYAVAIDPYGNQSLAQEWFIFGGQPAVAPWPMFGHDAQHKGQSPYLGAQSDNLKWVYSLLGGGWMDMSSPAIASDGTLYIGSGNGINAINSNGSLKWNFPTGYSTASSPAIGTDGTVYFGSDDGALYAVSSNGALRWKYSIGPIFNVGSYISSPVVSQNGVIYILSPGCGFYAINPDGTLKWSLDYPMCGYSSPAIASDGTIYVTGWSSNPVEDYWYDLYAVDPNGNIKWSYPANHVWSSPAIASDGTIHIGGEVNNSVFYAINPNGTLKWSYDTGYNQNINIASYSHPSIGKDGTIYIGSNDGNFYAINPDGSLKWKHTFADGTQNLYRFYSSSAIGSDGTVYIGGDDGVYAFNPDGTVKWSYPTGWIYSSPAIGSNETLYIRSGAQLYSFGPP